MSLLEVTELRRTFGALAAVDGVSFSLAPGEVCGLVGPNGSGKSTLLNLISGVLEPTSGAVTVDGAPIAGEPAHVAAGLGVRRTFQLLRLPRGVTVLESVLAGLYLGAPDARLVAAVVPSGAARSARAGARATAMATLERLGIARHAPHLVENLSLGIQRKVEFARAVVSRPRLLLLDEPAAGLDEASMQELAELVREQQADGTAVMLIDHHLELVLGVCPRVLVMNYGQMIFDGPGAEASADPRVREAYIGS